MRIAQMVAGVATVCALSIGPASLTWAADRFNADVAVSADVGDQSERGGNDTRRIDLTIPIPALAQCMPRAEMSVKVTSTAEKRGFDSFEMNARHVPPSRSYTVFLMQNANFPFGAVEYIGELNSDRQGNGHAEFHLIVDEAFTFVNNNGQNQRVNLNQIGVWFADPMDDDFCLGPNGPATGFDGDGAAGALVFNSATPSPMPAPHN